MKKYTIGLITGALLAVSAMMFIGASSSEVGLYQLSSTDSGDGDGYIYETVINTKTGKIQKRKVNKDYYKRTLLVE